MQAPRLALLPREKPGQWGSSQTCRDHGSLRAGQVACSEGQHNHIGVWHGIYFLYLFSKITEEECPKTT